MTIKLAAPQPPFAAHAVRTNPAVANAAATSSVERNDAMGLVYANIELIRGDDLALHRHGYIKEEEVKRITVNMLVDSGALMLTINERIRTQLDLKRVDMRSAELADGTVVKLEVVGPVEVRFANRRSSVDAMVLPGDVAPLLGAIPMEDMDVIVDPKQQRLIVNPEHPNIVQHSLK